MPNKTIPGSAGTAPQTGTAPENDPTPPAIPANPMTTTTTASSSGRVVSEGGRYFVIWGNNRIPIENVDDLPALAKKPVSTDATLASELQPAIDAAAKNRTELMALKEVVDIRAGYLFQNGAITSVPAVVVAVKPSPGKKFDKAAIKNELGLPATLNGVPVEIEIADPFRQLLASGAADPVPLFR